MIPEVTHDRTSPSRVMREGGPATHKQKMWCADILSCDMNDPRIKGLSRAEAELLIGGFKAAKAAIMRIGYDDRV